MLDPEVLEDLRCNICHNYLSVLPIYSYGGEQNVCGRCPINEDFAPQQAILYETVIKKIEFPCQYDMRGCPERTTPKEMKSHESTCSFRTFSCPCLNTKCEFQGNIEDLFVHFENEHPDDIFKNVELDVVNIYEKNYVFWEGTDTFVISLKCNNSDKKIYVQVKYLNSAKTDFTYTLQFSSKNNDNFIKIKGKTIYSEFKYIETKKPYETIIIDDVLNQLNNPAVIFSNIKIEKTRQNSIQRDISEMESNLLRTIECPICFCHMTPPILQCTKGHSFCKSCHQQLNNCPICRQSMSDTQNFLLEALTLKIDYPCKYQQYDCPFYGSAGEIRNHERNCIYGPFTCPFDECPWKDHFERFLKHIKDDHHDDLLDVPTVTYFIDPSCDDTVNYIINKFGNIFKVVFKQGLNGYKWNLQLIGPDSDHSKYALELDIKSPISLERIYYKKMCNPRLTNGEEFVNRDSYVEISRDALEGMIDENLLIYYCSVAQI